MGTPNVLLFILDSVRARNVGLYGYRRSTTPFLSEYGDRATVYTQSRSPGIHSVASHASLWTGVHVEQHQMREHEDELRSGTTIWETLVDEGYQTGLFTTNPIVAHTSNLSEPFDYECTDDFVDQRTKLFSDAHSPVDIREREGVTGNLRRCLAGDQPLRSLINSGYHFYKKYDKRSNSRVDSDKLVDDFLSWAKAADRPWGACINLMDAHFPYIPSPEFDRWGDEMLRSLHADLEKPPSYEFVQGRPWWQLEAFENLYDGAIREADEYLRRTVSGLEEHGLHEDTLVVVTSDHGEGFGEQCGVTGRTRLVDHSWGIDEVLTHVPLVVSYPEQSTPETVERLATLTEFPNTVTAMLDNSVSRDSFVPDGPVVASTDRLREADDVIFAGSEESPEDYYGPWRAVYERPDATVRKYVKHNDQIKIERIHSISCSTVADAERDGVVEQTFADLPSLDLKRGNRGPVSGTVEDRLTELGYLR